MTDTELKLLWAVCREPGDDTPRLAYADYLDETAGGDEWTPCPECHQYAADPENLFGGPGHRPERDPASGRHEGGWTNCKMCNGGALQNPGFVKRPDTRAVRADFVRLQVAIAAEKPVKTITRPIMSDASGGMPVAQQVVGHEYRPEYHDWCIRAAEVWRQAASSQKDWFGDPWHGWDLFPGRGAATRQSGSLSRGFVSEIALAWPDWKAYHADLFWPVDAPCGAWLCVKVGWPPLAGCTSCRGTGRVPNPAPFKGTEQPLTKVTFTTWPDTDISDVMDAETAAMSGWNTVGEVILGKLEKQWPGIRFALPNPYAPGQPAWTPQIEDDGFDPVVDGYDFDSGDGDA